VKPLFFGKFNAFYLRKRFHHRRMAGIYFKSTDRVGDERRYLQPKLTDIRSWQSVLTKLRIYGVQIKFTGAVNLAPLDGRNFPLKGI
jgi:hypothetical protein